jgi:hypothetical protein
MVEVGTMLQGEWLAARTSDVVVKTLGDEVLVYDLPRHRAHSLNAVAAAVWRACDGARDVPALAAAAEATTGQPVPLDAVRFALQELGRARLLIRPVASTGLTRRELIRRLGTAAAVALPLVTSVVAPTAAQAQSCLDNGDPCTGSAQCCGPLCTGQGGCECSPTTETCLIIE